MVHRWALPWVEEGADRPGEQNRGTGGGNGRARRDPPADRSERGAPEELAHTRGLDYPDEQPRRQQRRTEHERASASHNRRLTELGSHQSGEGDRTGATCSACRSRHQPRSDRPARSDDGSQRDLTCERLSQRGVGALVQ